MNKKSLVTIQILDLFGSPISKAQYVVKNQRTRKVIAAGPTNSSGCIVEISQDKGTTLDVYIKSMFKGSMVKVQSFVMSKDRMVVKITSPKVLLDLKTLTNQGNNGQYKRKTHIVKKGDTLFEIAQKNHTTVRALERLNKIDDPNKISVGQVIKLPVHIPASGNHSHQDKPKHKHSAQSTNKPTASSAKTTPAPAAKRPANPASQTKQENGLPEKAHQLYEDTKKALNEAASSVSKILTVDDRSQDGGTPKANTTNICKTNPQCISSGKSELIREVNIRLAGFGGALPTDEFTELTATCIKQFQRDYMGVPDTGKICGSVLAALDRFRDEYGIASYFESMKCPCGECSGFGRSRSGNFRFEMYNKTTRQYVEVYRDAKEYNGMHRSLIWALKAMLFYFKKMPNSAGYKIVKISSGYRCIDNNWKNRRPTTNHMGCALDIVVHNKNNQVVSMSELENQVRIKWFGKYLNTSLGWSPDKFGLERISDGAKTWVHLDVREFNKKYKIDKLFSTSKDGLNGDYLINLFKADEKANKILGCSGIVVSPNKNPNLNDSSLEDLIRQLGSVISHGEGNYESYNTGTKNVKGDKVGYSFKNPGKGTVTSKRIQQIIDNAEAKDGNDKNRLFATGKYQTTYYTLQEGIKQGYFTGSEVYDANMQEQVFREFLISKRTKLSQFVRKGIGSLRDAQYDAAQEWASVAVPKGLPLKNGKISDGNKSYYEKPGQNSSSPESTKMVLEILEKIHRFHKDGK
ncbi:LysM peptidoglycan-binding domain-containing protein [Acinetobacter baumannii]|uniref:LysM peptidoglycan-binding domain-containing protein n=1 Tax=Acinetobacter baumannii TaxID=470 RepID=A0A8B5UCL1_ACIBA|nr:LysM peptidoglycan-binding domain-containing protein [Acinetobacter baumannii]TPU60581.1 LysM peptidoglycan-binding domain-containing protein [Acinetobacter baumannii]